jgi:hypothetical protein
MSAGRYRGRKSAIPPSLLLADPRPELQPDGTLVASMAQKGSVRESR